jgi:hypothetical protein
MPPTKKKPEQPDEVRTTIEIAAELWVRSKQLAAAERTTMKVLIAEGLGLVLKSRKGRS